MDSRNKTWSTLLLNPVFVFCLVPFALLLSYFHSLISSYVVSHLLANQPVNSAELSSMHTRLTSLFCTMISSMATTAKRKGTESGEMDTSADDSSSSSDYIVRQATRKKRRAKQRRRRRRKSIEEKRSNEEKRQRGKIAKRKVRVFRFNDSPFPCSFLPSFLFSFLSLIFPFLSSLPCFPRFPPPSSCLALPYRGWG